MKKTKGKIVGHAVEWSTADIERISSITPEDIAVAKAIYRRLAPKRIKRLPDAIAKNRG